MPIYWVLAGLNWFIIFITTPIFTIIINIPKLTKIIIIIIIIIIVIIIIIIIITFQSLR